MALGQACKRERAASRKANEGVRDGSPKGRDTAACEGGSIHDSPPRLAGRRPNPAFKNAAEHTAIKR
jgi:hypothetical protein